MNGSSSTWYATSARLRTSRSSAARAAVVALEDGKQLLRVTHELVGLLAPQDLVVVDAAPRDGDCVNAGRLRSADIERRVADVRGLARRGAEPLECLEDRIGRRLVAFGVIRGDHNVQVRLELGKPVEREADGGAALRRHDSQPAAVITQPREHLDDLPERLQFVVQ